VRYIIIEVKVKIIDTKIVSALTEGVLNIKIIFKYGDIRHLQT